MAMAIRKASERGRTEIDWLDSRHTFSFGDYHDPSAMGFRVMRVLNDDRVIAGAGFPTHAHRDMEIVTYVLDGGLEQRHPDQAIRPMHVLADVGDRDVGDLAAVFVSDAADEHDAGRG